MPSSIEWVVSTVDSFWDVMGRLEAGVDWAEGLESADPAEMLRKASANQALICWMLGTLTELSS